jgi:hypothetical protein
VCIRVAAATAVALLCAQLVGAFSRSAGASTTGTLQARAKLISQQLIQEQLQAGAYQQQYSVATQRVTDDEQGIARTQAAIAEDERSIATRTKDIRRLALITYVLNGSLSSSTGPSLFSENVETVHSADVYASVSLGSMNEVIEQLRTAERVAQAARSSLSQQEAADLSEQAREANYLQQADTTTQQLSSVQAEVTGQLAAAVSQQQSAAAAAAEAAVARAERNSADLSADTVDPTLPPFLVCVRQAESGGNYAAVSPNGRYMGAFQFDQPTWNYAANAAGRDDLVGVPPNETSKPDQDTVAVTLYSLDGERPWLGDRCS